MSELTPKFKMVCGIIPNWVGFHALYTANKEGQPGTAQLSSQFWWLKPPPLEQKHVRAQWSNCESCNPKGAFDSPKISIKPVT